MAIKINKLMQNTIIKQCKTPLLNKKCENLQQFGPKNS